MALLARLASIVARTLTDLPLPLGFPFIPPLASPSSRPAISFVPVSINPIGSDRS